MNDFVIRGFYSHDVVIKVENSSINGLFNELISHDLIQGFNKRLRLSFDSNYFSPTNTHLKFGRELAQEIAYLHAIAISLFRRDKLTLEFDVFFRDFLDEAFKNEKADHFNRISQNIDLFKENIEFQKLLSSFAHEFHRIGLKDQIPHFVRAWQSSFSDYLFESDSSHVLDLVNDGMWVEMMFIQNGRSLNSAQGLAFKAEVPSSTAIIPNKAYAGLFDMANVGTEKFISFLNNSFGEHWRERTDGGIDAAWGEYFYEFNKEREVLTTPFDLCNLIDRSDHSAIPIYFGSFRLIDILCIKPDQNMVFRSGYLGLITDDLNRLAYIGLEHDRLIRRTHDQGAFVPVIRPDGELAHTDCLFDLVGRLETIHAEVAVEKSEVIPPGGKKPKRPTFPMIDVNVF